MSAPGLDGVSVGTKRLGKVIANARRQQRMRVGNRHQRQRPRIGPFLWILRQQPWTWMGLIEIFDDRQRLEHGMAVVNECRYDPLSIDGRIPRLELLSRENVDRDFLKLQTLELKRDAHAE